MSDERSATTMPRHRHCVTCTCNPPSFTLPADASLATLSSAIASIEEEIEQRTQALLQFKRKRNDHVPVARIPNEVLSEIFLYFRDARPLSIDGFPHQQLCHTVLMVSSHWRAVAFSDPRLWNTPDLRFPKLVDNFSRYYGALPLHVTLSERPHEDLIDYESNHGAITTLLRTNNPIASLELYGSTSEIDECITMFLGREQHDMHVLHLNNVLDEECLSIKSFESARIPNLRVLSLRAMSFGGGRGILSSCAGSIKEISFDGCLLDVGLEPLASLSRLQKLSFKNCVPRIFAQDTRARIAFPALKEFYVSHGQHHCLSLLKALQLPPGCHATVWPHTLSFSSILPDLAAHIAAHPCKRVCVYFKKGNVTVEREAPGNAVVHTLRLSAGDQMYQYPWMQVLPAISIVIHNSKPESLLISYAGMTVSDLAELCGGSTAITTLTTRGMFLDTLAQCLRAHETFLPQLATLQIEDADFTHLTPALVGDWKEGAALRRGTLKKVAIARCTGESAFHEEGLGIPHDLEKCVEGAGDVQDGIDEEETPRPPDVLGD